MVARFWQNLLARLWHEDEGLLTFEYIVLNTVLVIGTVGAMSGVRDTLNSELTGLNDSMRSLDQMRPANLAAISSNHSGSASNTAQPSSTATLVPLLNTDAGVTAADAMGGVTLSTTSTTTSPQNPAATSTSLPTTNGI